MVVKNIPTVYAPPPKQSVRDIVDTLIDACPGDVHGNHPCGQCLHCASREIIVKLRKYIRHMENNRVKSCG